MPDFRHLDSLTSAPKAAPDRPSAPWRPPAPATAPAAVPAPVLEPTPAPRPLDSGRRRTQEFSPEAAAAYAQGYPPGYPGEYAAPGPGEATHLLDYVRILYRRRWLAATAFLLVVAAAVVYTFTRTPVYQAKAQIQIDYVDPNVVPFRQVTENQAGWDTTEYFQTQYKILQSRSLAKRTLDAAKLWRHPMVTGGVPGGPGTGESKEGVRSGPAGDSGKPAVSPAQAAAAGSTETPEQTPVVDALLGGLTIAPVRNSRLVDVKYSSPDAVFAATVANAWTKAYIEQNLDSRLGSSKEATDFLGEQIDKQRGEVEAAEQALQQYREKTDALAPDDKQNIVDQELADLNAALTRAKTERLQKQAQYDQVRRILHDRAALDTFPAILANGFVQQLKGQLADLQRQRAALGEKFGEKHEQMVRLQTQIEQAEARITGEVAKVVESIRNEYLAAQAQENNLSAALERQKDAAMALRRKGIDYSSLQRDAATKRQMLDTLLQRARETQVGAELKASNVRVVDAATVPRGPISPNKPRNLLLGIFAGGIFAIGLVFFFEYLDNRIKSPEEIKHVLGLPFLGLVPLLKGDDEPENALLHAGVPVGFAEAFRTIRTNVLFSSTEEGGRSVVVTSTGPGEGKTLVATNLAVALAQAGQRVLLVDADMRKPRVQQVFDMKGHPGLSNVLVGNAKASDAVRKGPVQNLYVLVAGVTPPNPAELLASHRFRDFLCTLQEHFDWVIVDAPPVMAVTDAAVVAHVTHGVVFVVGCEQTNKHTANAAIEQLEAARSKFLGAILNKVDVDRNSYYYSHYYKRSYSAYYKGTGSK